MSVRALRVARISVFILVSMTSVVVMGLTSQWLSATLNHGFGYFEYAALALATSLLSLSIPIMIVVEAFWPNAFTTMIIFEVAWLGFLSLMWLITTALSARHVDVYSQTCVLAYAPRWWKTGCKLTSGILALSVLSWLALAGYVTALLTMCIIAQRHDTPVWTSKVASADLTRAVLVDSRKIPPSQMVSDMMRRDAMMKSQTITRPPPREHPVRHQYPPHGVPPSATTEFLLE